MAKVGPKDTVGAGCVKPPPVPSRQARCDFLVLSLAFARKIRINRAIRGSRPGAERTVSAISPYQATLMWQGQSVRRPVLPPSEHIESFPKGSKGLPPGPRQHRKGNPCPFMSI